MKKVIMGCFVVAVLAVPTFVKADVASGTLVVTGTVASSISLTVETGTVGPVLTDTTTNAASTDLGTTFAKYGGTTPTGWTKTLQASTWTLTADFKVKVVKANSDSASYTLTTHLSTDPGTVGWTAGVLPYVGTAPHDLATSGDYGTAANYAWTIVIPDNLTTPDLGNTMNFEATAN
jgi:hypothetical protein